MKKKLLIIATLMFAVNISISLYAAGNRESEDNMGNKNIIEGVLTVELIYLNHGPVRKVISDIVNLLELYNEEIQVIHYTFSSPEGKSFAESKKMEGHIPLAVFINGSMKFTIDSRSFEFISFPQGGGTGFVEDGEWSLDDLKQVINRFLEQN